MQNCAIKTSLRDKRSQGTTLRNFISHTSGHQMCGGFAPHQVISCDTNWVFCSLTQFWHCLPGDSIRSHRLRAQSHKPGALQPLHPVSSPGITCTSDQPITDEVPMTPLLGFNQFAKTAHWTQGNTYLHLTVYWYRTQMNSQMKR